LSIVNYPLFKEMFDAYRYYKSMEEHNILLLFKGTISEDLLTSLLQITESRLEKMEEQPKMKKKVFNVLVECLQNVYHHVDNKSGSGSGKNNIEKTSSSSAILILGKVESDYFIVTGNHVLADKVDGLKKRLDELNKLSKEELKALYQDILTNEKYTDKGGAGLGFVDIMRKTGQKIEYGFKEIDDEFSFFSLKAKISPVKT